MRTQPWYRRRSTQSRSYPCFVSGVLLLGMKMRYFTEKHIPFGRSCNYQGTEYRCFCLTADRQAVSPARTTPLFPVGLCQLAICRNASQFETDYQGKYPGPAVSSRAGTKVAFTYRRICSQFTPPFCKNFLRIFLAEAIRLETFCWRTCSMSAIAFSVKPSTA